MENNISCCECKKELQEGDEYMTYNNINLVKCRACHELDPFLRNFQETKVFTRVVGYYQSVDATNPGKKAEINDRKVYKIKNEE